MADTSGSVVALAPLWVRAAPIAGGALLAIGSGIVVEQVSTRWVDAVANASAWDDQGWFVFGLLLLVFGFTWCILVSIRKDPADAPSYDAILARLGFALVVAGLLNFIALFGLASRELLLAVVRPTDTEVAAAQVTPKPTEGALPSGLEYLSNSKEKEPAKPNRESPGRARVIWGARMSLLPGFAILGSMFFVCGSLQRKRNENEDDAVDASYNSERFWSGFWYRMGEGILFGLVAFLASYAGFLGAGEKSWSALLLLLGLLMAMFVKPAEQLVNGLALQLFEAVTTFTKRTLKDGPAEKVIDPLSPIVQRLNDSLETVRLQAVRELERLAKTRYEDVVDILAAFLRQQSGKSRPATTADVQQAFVALGTLKPPRGKKRRAVSLRKAILVGVRRETEDLDLTGYDFSDADLSGSDLSKSNLSGATLVGTQLMNANLGGANLREAVGVPKAKVDGAEYDDTTSFPDGFKPKDAGMSKPNEPPPAAGMSGRVF